MYIALCWFPIVFYSLSSLSGHWALPEHWSHAAGTCAWESACWTMDARKALRKVEWRWDEGRWFGLGNQVVLSFAGSLWLLQGLSVWEDGSSGLTHVWLGRKLWGRFEKGVGWKGIVICSSLAGKDADWVLLWWKCLLFLTLTSLRRRDGLAWSHVTSGWKGTSCELRLPHEIDVWHQSQPEMQHLSFKLSQVKVKQQHVRSKFLCRVRKCDPNSPTSIFLQCSFQSQKICPSQSGKHENLVWVHYSSYTLAWMAITFLAFWHQLCRWARAGLPSVPRSVTSWLLSCIVSSVVWTQAKGM